MKINVVLFQPEIPQNTGNISRTCSATASVLHLVHPLGFSLDEKHLRRAGLDYWEGLDIREYESDEDFFQKANPKQIFYFSQKGANTLWDMDIHSNEDIYLVFGRESRGLDDELLESNIEKTVRIPMLEGKRSLNLSNAVAVAVYETIRRTGLEGLKEIGRLGEPK